jgi:hypothetical protein
VYLVFVRDHDLGTVANELSQKSRPVPNSRRRRRANLPANDVATVLSPLLHEPMSTHSQAKLDQNKHLVRTVNWSEDDRDSAGMFNPSLAKLRVVWNENLTCANTNIDVEMVNRCSVMNVTWLDKWT